MKLSGWYLAAGGFACLAAAYLFAAPLMRDELLHFARAWQERSEGVDLAHDLVSAESMLGYIAAHPDQVSLASWEIGADYEGIAYNAQRPQPVVSGGSLLLLAAASAELGGADLGRQLVPLSDWERYWLPGSDGGAHEAALHALRANASEFDQAGMVVAGVAASRGESTQFRLDDIVAAFVRHGDPAAADWLIDRLGRPVLTERMRQLGFQAEATPRPCSGVLLSMLDGTHAAELLARYRVMPRQEYYDATWVWLQRLRDDAAFRETMRTRLEQASGVPSLREAADLHALLSPRGTASAYARLMERIASGDDQAAQYARSHLAWPLEGPATRNEFEAFGSLSGSQPGIHAAVAYGRAKGSERTRVLALMFHKLPLGVWLHLSSGFVLRRFQNELLADDGFFRRARETLHAVAKKTRPQDARLTAAPHKTNETNETKVRGARVGALR